MLEDSVFLACSSLLRNRIALVMKWGHKGGLLMLWATFLGGDVMSGGICKELPFKVMLKSLSGIRASCVRRGSGGL